MLTAGHKLVRLFFLPGNQQHRLDTRAAVLHTNKVTAVSLPKKMGEILWNKIRTAKQPVQAAPASGKNAAGGGSAKNAENTTAKGRLTVKTHGRKNHPANPALSPRHKINFRKYISYKTIPAVFKMKKDKIIKFSKIIFLFAAAFLAGRLVAWATAPAASPSVNAQTENWGLSFQQEGKPPVANATFDELKKYNAYYAENTEEKVIYLTFDCGYENGNTTAILDALKKHQVPATFFVVGTYISSSPDLIKRIAEEGHIVGNHTYHHPDMSKISTKESFQKELADVESLYKEITGKEMLKYYRPPQGKYSTDNLKMAQEMGYTTFFWSLAYVDWYQDKQPSKEEAFKKLLGRIHPGAVVLLHSTSSTNAQILDELLTKWEEMGYTFKSLDQLPATQPETA